MRFSRPKRKEYEPVVQSGLSLTPSDISNLMKEGKPVSTSNLPGFYDDPSLGDEVPRETMRGIDIVDLWEDVETAQVKTKKARKALKEVQSQTRK